MKIHSKRDAKLLLILAVIITIGLYFRVQDFSHNVDGSHIFRQTMMTSNIFHFIENGISLTTKLFTKNHTHKIFDFPIYQQLVTGIIVLFELEIVQAGRALNIFIYVLTTLVLYKILVFLDLKRQLIFIVLFLFSLSPLGIFYSRALIPDNLPVLLGFLSLFYFLKWDLLKSNKIYHYTGMTATGILAALIKNPIYLPIVIAIIMYLAFNRRWKQLLSPAIITFLTTILMTVIFFRLYSNYVNQGDPFLSATWEHYWYFSNMQDRMNPLHYFALIKQYFRDVVPPPFLFFAIVGIFIYQKNYNNQSKYLFLGLLLGSIITILIFFNVMRRHNYYWIPYIFITCFFTGCCIDWFYSSLQGWLTKKTSRYRLMRWNQELLCKTIIPRSMILVFISLTVLLSYRFTITRVEQHWQINAGMMINQNTPLNAMVIYVVSNDAGWDPSYLYYARREGYNVSSSGLTVTFLEEKLNEVKTSNFYLFIPKIYPIANQHVLQEFHTRLVAESSDGILLKFMKDVLGHPPN
ncbi:MAG: hypothetical protein HQM14_06025 [SAR324 cluster bacterium]|nr:hypothetical protein [SAR324 cluster bacterium]